MKRPAMKQPRKFTVQYARDEDGWWVASVRGLRGCHTQGRSLDEARRRVREALSLCVEGAESAELVDVVKLPRDLELELRRAAALRRKAVALEEQAQAQVSSAARALRRAKISTRDAGRLLGLSHQRVHQVLGE
ncbi:MAG: type II toxin-antitoxin system HicB family antitoxin [Deltaproteobacteria bacterium]|nr:type II toxin-antitoxin system HicB family antitoxin [Deltaproteobacteria bacterium]